MSGRTLAMCAAMAVGMVLTGTWLVSPTWAADDEQKPAAAGQQAQPAGQQQQAQQPMSQEQQWAEYEKMSLPGPEHDKLKEMAGTWDAQIKFFNPDGSAMGDPQKGTMRGEMILGGRYLQLKYEGSMGMPNGQSKQFKGMGISGYDKTKKKYCNVWIDEMGTGMMITEGTMDGDVLTSTGECSDPMSGHAIKVKEVATRVDQDHHKYEMYMAGPDGNMMKVMEIQYTRKAAA